MVGSFCWAQNRAPLQADLVSVMDAGRVKVGDVVLAKVVAKWESPECALREGAILNGRIVAQRAHSKTENTSQIALVFDKGQCGGKDMKALPMTVSAVLAMDPVREQSSYANQPLSEAAGLGLGSSPGPNGGGPSGTGASSSGKRSVMQAAATVYVSPPVYKGPTTVLPGMVVGIKGVKLNVGGGPEGSSVLSLAGHNVRLEAGAQFLLMPNLNAVAAASPASGSTSSSSAASSVTGAGVSTATKAPEVEPADETEICSPPQCSVALAPSEAGTSNAAAAATLSVKALGYTQTRPDHEMYKFDYGSAICYLGAGDLLFTFNPHRLVPRNGPEVEFAKLRVIRAVLIDVHSQRVEKTVEWKVPDSQQYLWPIGGDHALVHVGRELRLYGPGLKQEQRLALDGPLAYVRTSPSAKYFAVGVIKERHSNDVHRQLADAEQQEPEEDIEVKVLDGGLHTLATVMRSSRSEAPVLSDNGEIQVVSAGRGRWKIIEESWDTQKRVLASVNSRCTPQTTTLPPDLIFVIGCDRQTANKWYRMLRPDGKPVLKGSSPMTVLEHAISGMAAGSAFTIGIAEAAKAVGADAAFRTSDVADERIAVYRSDTGARIFAVTVPYPEPTVQTFGLSPDGGQLAVLAGDQISFYSLLGAGRSR
ncbi:MAG TPA: hypothetical protein VK828_16440 [Terriglobales bacterium]|nr:hypothetical protein [Terriglobales bacterium]